MAYEKYKEIVTMDEFYSNWSSDSLSDLSEEIMQRIYEKYVLKAMCFQRDDFKCQNEFCRSPESQLTLHHIKFQKNNGKDSLKNCVTICRACHSRFHEGKDSLTFWGMTYKIHKENDVDWKEVKSKGKRIRKQNEKFHGYRISWEMLCVLMKFLEINFDDFDEDD